MDRLLLAGAQLLGVHLYMVPTRLIAHVFMRPYLGSQCFGIWEWHQTHRDLADQDFLLFSAAALEVRV
jgi:hypothetical protein